jgi:hypothetical protein
VSKPDEGTSEFKVARLRDLLEGEETGQPAKGKGKTGGGGGGGNRNRQLAIAGGAVAAVLVVILGVSVLGGDGDGTPGGGGEGRFDTPVQVDAALVSRIEKNDTVSVCSPDGPLAEGVVVTAKTVADQIGFGPVATLLVATTDEESGRLTPQPDGVYVLETKRCNRGTAPASTPTTPATAEPTPETGPPDTTPAQTTPSS